MEGSAEGVGGAGAEAGEDPGGRDEQLVEQEVCVSSCGSFKIDSYKPSQSEYYSN